MFSAIINSRYSLWVLLALPSVPMVAGLAAGSAEPEQLLHSSGEFAARFMIIAMAVTPLRMMFPTAAVLRWLMQRRRYFGVAAFSYALLHTVLYVVDMGTLQRMLDELPTLGIWTGWAAFAIFLPLVATSNDLSQRLLRGRWLLIQRWVYAAAVLTLVHWIFVHNNVGPALFHFVPLAILETYRLWTMTRRRPVASPINPT